MGLLMDEKNQYLFAEPGMHRIKSCFTRSIGNRPIRGCVVHGDRTICIVEQGFIGYVRLCLHVYPNPHDGDCGVI